MSEKPLFIFGAARSGTSFFSRLLRDHFDYGLGPEAKFLVDLVSRTNQLGDLKHDKALHSLIDHLLNTEMVQIVNTRYSEHFKKDMVINKQDVLNHVTQRSCEQVILALFAAIGERMGKKRIGNKYPDYWKHLPQLLNWYPDAQFIHLLRDGRDVALSTRQMNWGPNTIYGSACEWKRMLEKVQLFKKNIPKTQFLQLRYEDLLQKPEMTYHQLCQFLDFEAVENQNQAFVQQISQSKHSGKHHRWPSQMSRHNLRLYEGIAGDQLLQGGYGVNIHQKQISWPEHTYYQFEDYSRRLIHKTHNLLIPA